MFNVIPLVIFWRLSIRFHHITWLISVSTFQLTHVTIDQGTQPLSDICRATTTTWFGWSRCLRKGHHTGASIQPRTCSQCPGQFHHLLVCYDEFVALLARTILLPFLTHALRACFQMTPIKSTTANPTTQNQSVRKHVPVFQTPGFTSTPTRRPSGGGSEYTDGGYTK